MEARSTKQAQGSKKQKPRDRGQKQLIWLSKKDSWVQHKYMQVQKNIPTGSRKHTGTSARPPHFLCPQVPKKTSHVKKTCTSPKKGCPGPRSKKHASRLIYCSTMLPKASPTARKCSEVSLTRCRATARNHVIVQQSWNDQVLAHNAWAANGSLGGIADDASTKGFQNGPAWCKTVVNHFATCRGTECLHCSIRNLGFMLGIIAWIEFVLETFPF